ncbi:unnamed protein product [Trichobilharzia regenti]|nr:unnamed protein product [Trichobilharzia regenti]
MEDAGYSVSKRKPQQIKKTNSVRFDDEVKVAADKPNNSNYMIEEKPRRSSINVLRNKFFRSKFLIQFIMPFLYTFKRHIYIRPNQTL